MPRSLLAIVLALTACGSVKTEKLPDSPAAADAAPDSGPHGRVTVKLLDPQGSGSGVLGSQVVFIDANGTQRGVTDANGIASAEVLDGASVTVVSSQGQNQPFLQTVFGAKSGDTIVLNQVFDNRDAGTFTVNFTPVASVAGSYQVFGPCGSTSTATGTATLNFTNDCKQDPMDIIVVGTNTTTGASLGSIERAAVPFLSGGSTTINGAFRAFLNLTASYSNAALATNLDLQRFTPDDRGFQSGISGVPTNGLATLAALGPNTSTAVLETFITRPSFGQQTVLQRVAGASTTYGLDVEASVLPWFGLPTFDATTGTIHQPVDPANSSGDAPDLFFTAVGYLRAAQADGGVSTQIQWLLFGPTPGDVVLPELPTDLAELAPRAADTIQEQFSGAVESDAIPGYDQARVDPYAAVTILATPRGVTGRTRLTQVFSGID